MSPEACPFVRGVWKARAKDIKRVCDNRFGWLSNAGLTNTKLQRRFGWLSKAGLTKTKLQRRWFGWLSKAGLTNTKLQRRWCAIHNLKLYYYENPRATEPKGAVDLKGAMIHK
ncbi:hypothetical protein T484DRAFT_1788937 [Baffinella frigidus]|nr:hypothetical protein T484DRAFT_1788937 [Cryptophyta sp. CCMP2293]